jgi:NADH-quinone oxidoreductase E subunit
MDSDTRKQLDVVLSGYSRDKSDLIPVLQAAQEKLGYLPGEVMAEIASFLKLPASSVYGVGTFYAQFKLQPVGRKVVKVCRGTACHVRGAARILQELETRLKIKPGETTQDREYSLETIACFGSCALAPVMVMDKTVYGRMTPKKVDSVLEEGK